MDPHAFSVAIRWLHVAAMAMALGGAVLLTLAARSRDTAPNGLLGVAMSYERAFWLAAGILVMTGIGNAAAFGASLPAPNTSWGSAFVVKLGAVAALVFLSVPRTVVLVHLGAVADPARVARIAGRLYGATAVGLLAILALAVWLAHG